MKTLAKAVFIGALTVAGSLGAMTPASARDSVAFSFNTGDVAFAYSDGWWDHNHVWHRWHGREAREYRRAYGDHYHAWRHDRDRDLGWRDDDRDGVPNRFDRAPENPYRR
jgi:hypothetical protein